MEFIVFEYNNIERESNIDYHSFLKYRILFP